MTHGSLKGLLGAVLLFGGVALVAMPVSAVEAAETASVAADPATVDDLVAAVKATYKDIESIRADFTQVTRSAAMGDGEKQKGSVTLKRPRKMQWLFTVPAGKQFVTDGTTMWVWSQSDNQVIVTSDLGGSSAGGGADMTSLLSSLDQLDQLFQVQLVGRDGGATKNSYVVELTPKSPGAYKSLRLTLTSKKYELEELVLTDAMDTVTELAFAHVKVNGDVPDSTFAFKIPAGAQVVRTDGL